MKPVVRAALAFAASVLLVLGAKPEPASASTADLEYRDCFCAEVNGGGACQHFLRNPAGPTDDPCWCDKCRNAVTGQRHDGNTLPSGWNQTTFQTGTMDHYLRRHSVAWGITCSECYASDKGWPEAAPPENDFGGRPARETVTKRLEAERRFFKKPDDAILAYNKHFYLATDISGLKVRMPGGTSRLISKHEWAHLTIERAEFARREWVRNLGEPSTGRPVAMFFTEKERDCNKLEAEYFRSPGAKSLRGNGSELCDKMCLTGIAFSADRTGDDPELQLSMRHQLAHNWVSLWGSHEIRPKSIPVWMDEGLAHWLSRTLPNLSDDATYCVGEAQVGGGGGAGGRGVAAGGPSWSGKGWDKDVARYVQSGKLCVIEQFLAKSEMKHMEEEDHKRAWSYVDLCLTEWREPFVAMLRALRQEKEVRDAFQENLGLRPEDFDARWRDRVLGKRRTMAPLPTDDEDPSAPGARDRKAIRSETVPQTLAARVRALGEIKDKKTVAVVIDVMAQNSDLVRETAFVTLLKTKDVDCIEALWPYGLDHPDAIVRAYTARLCGRLGIAEAIPKLEAQLADKNWYARAEAALACGVLKDAKAMAGMRKIVDSDPAEKAKIAAIDALAMFKEDARAAVPVVAKHLDSAQWQLRIASAQALGEMGCMEGVEPLVARMEKETGRIAEEIYASLKKISRDDLGRKPENWRTWWERLKVNSPGGVPERPPEEKKKPAFDPNDPHATRDSVPSPYFGIEIYSNRVAFVIDATETMLTLFTADPAGAKVLSREYAGRDKLTICKEEVAQALAGLDPRAFFNVIAFGMQIRSFKSNPVPASKGNIDAAVGFMKSLPGQGRTNYYGALKAVLDIGDEPDTNANFKATPDTITFLTDGLPNEGDIIDADTLLEWYTGLNRYARVKTHTITFGLVGVDMPLLRGLAERNGGRFTIVPEAPLKSK